LVDACAAATTAATSPTHVLLFAPLCVQALMALAPESATVVELDEEGRVLTEQTVSSRLVHHGDLLKVRDSKHALKACS